MYHNEFNILIDKFSFFIQLIFLSCREMSECEMSERSPAFEVISFSFIIYLTGNKWQLKFLFLFSWPSKTQTNGINLFCKKLNEFPKLDMHKIFFEKFRQCVVVIKLQNYFVGKEK